MININLLFGFYSFNFHKYGFYKIVNSIIPKKGLMKVLKVTGNRLPSRSGVGPSASEASVKAQSPAAGV